MERKGSGPDEKRRLLRTLGGGALCAIFAACGQGVPEPVDSDSSSQPANFEANVEGVRFVRALGESMANGQQPPLQDVQRLKKLALLYPGVGSIEELHTALLTGLEDWEGVSTYFEAKDDLTPEERFTLTWACLKQQDYPRARQAIEAYAGSNGDSVEAQRLLGRANYFLGEFDSAAAAYDKVWDQILSRGYTTDIAYRAMIDFDRGQIPRALSLLNGALQAVPDSIPVLNSLARILASQGRLEEAESYSNQVARLKEAHDRKASAQSRRSSRIMALNLALETGDYAGCERLVFQFLPEASDDFAEELILLLDKMYTLAGREADLPDVLSRAQAVRGKQ